MLNLVAMSAVDRDSELGFRVELARVDWIGGSIWPVGLIGFVGAQN